MTKRNTTYGFFLLFITFGVIIDGFFWPTTMPSYTLNDFIQMIGIIILCRLWQNADAAELGFEQSSARKIITILLPPAGIATYLFQTRNWKMAIVAFFLFWLGLAMAAIVTVYTIYEIVNPLVSDAR